MKSYSKTEHFHVTQMQIVLGRDEVFLFFQLMMVTL